MAASTSHIHHNSSSPLAHDPMIRCSASYTFSNGSSIIVHHLQPVALPCTHFMSVNCDSRDAVNGDHNHHESSISYTHAKLPCTEAHYIIQYSSVASSSSIPSPSNPVSASAFALVACPEALPSWSWPCRRRLLHPRSDRDRPRRSAVKLAHVPLITRPYAPVHYSPYHPPRSLRRQGDALAGDDRPPSRVISRA